MSAMKELTKGFVKENPTFVQLLGMCPTLAVTTSVFNGLGMGLSVTAVLMASNVVISLIRKCIPNKIRIASYVVVIAGFVTMIEMLLKAYVPTISKSLGLFIPLIVVNCIILARAEAFASKNTVGKSALDGLGMGLGFTMALVIISAIREVLGNGTFFGISVFGAGFQPVTLMLLPPGAFIVLGLLLGGIQLLSAKCKGGDQK
ncbi:MAG: electron transport complex subunit E [Clostridia bacterium]|nr:electron transport complex subunit E [Clostridia bacterium]